MALSAADPERLDQAALGVDGDHLHAERAELARIAVADRHRNPVPERVEPLRDLRRVDRGPADVGRELARDHEDGEGIAHRGVTLRGRCRRSKLDSREVRGVHFCINDDTPLARRCAG